MLPQLQLRDILALSQTSQQTRTLVQTRVPPATWTAAARASHIPCQPGASSTACHQRLRSLAASHAALCAGQPQAVTSSDVQWQGAPRSSEAHDVSEDDSEAGSEDDSEDDWCGVAAILGATPDSSGTRVVSMHWDVLQVVPLCSQRW